MPCREVGRVSRVFELIRETVRRSFRARFARVASKYGGGISDRLSPMPNQQVA